MYTFQFHLKTLEEKKRAIILIKISSLKIFYTMKIMWKIT